ncbi:DUF305 domain-containing protein [Micromonospora endolithica]|uniref:DUF305 domain-containing protein n=1 Tax=Micromonospora endolithica TaxID=230091 RepID=A0A3A9ZQC5_9ACTN|nr:DUF305 domain-containing protein [Micromonospora endolithica]RKN50385.1 DUF305 domain-containing protein [Micromonospora endolithica]TWJ20938.1 uncharacterized protein (DUF305 family) [Micromonospora endolithica]
MSRKRFPLVGAGGFVALAIAIGGCSDGLLVTAAVATASPHTPGPAGSAHGSAMFAAMMVSHHEEGIEFAQLAVNKASTPGVKTLAERSLRHQQAELPELRRIAQGGNMTAEPPEPPLAKFNEQEMSELQALSGREFDLGWLDAFSAHHMSAIMMADMELASGEGQATDLARKIHDEQLQDVSEMNNLRDQLR